jgi:heat shock protein HslJ
MNGAYSRSEDQALFQECVTGKTYPVIADQGALKNIHPQQGSTPGESLLIRLEGHIVRQPTGQNAGDHEAILVNKFAKNLPQSNCREMLTVVSLTDTRWELVELNGKAVSNQASLFVELQQEGKKFGGHGGCNGFWGDFKMTADGELQLSKLSRTLMACGQEIMQLEDDFMNTLESARRFSILSPKLYLYAGDKQVAVFQARF